MEKASVMMKRKSLVFMLVLGVVLMAVSLTSTRNKEGTFEDSAADFTSPEEIAPNTQYEFVLEVFNAAFPSTDKEDWINEVVLYLPEGYWVNENEVFGPACLHPGEYCRENWHVQYDAAGNKITWWPGSQEPPDDWGDIREQETQTFRFPATTDYVPIGEFFWLLRGDMGGEVSGSASISVEGADDDFSPDDDAADDDDDVSGDDDDDSDDDIAPDDDAAEPEDSQENEDDGGSCGS